MQSTGECCRVLLCMQCQYDGIGELIARCREGDSESLHELSRQISGLIQDVLSSAQATLEEQVRLRPEILRDIIDRFTVGEEPRFAEWAAARSLNIFDCWLVERCR